MNSYSIRDDHSRSVVICDSEILYAAHLAEYLHSVSRLPYKVQIYSGTQMMQECILAEQVVLLVIAESLYSSSLAEEGYRNLLILNESEKTLEGLENVSKFQQVEAIAARICFLCMEEAEDFPGLRHGAPMKLIGLYSPMRDSLTEAASASLLQLLSGTVSTLYVNLEPYPCFEELYDCPVDGSLQDLLYYNACAKEKFASRLHFMTTKAGDLSILPAMDPWMQAGRVQAEQWLEFIASIDRVTDYRYAVLELSEIVDGMLEILRRCDHVLTFTYGDSLSQARMHKYTELLKATQYEDVFMKTRILEIPEGLRPEMAEEGLTQKMHGILRMWMKEHVQAMLDGGNR